MHGLKQVFKSWVNYSNLRSNPEWYVHSDNQQLFLFNFEKNYGLNELKNSLQKAKKRRTYFSIPRDKIKILDSFFSHENSKIFYGLTHPTRR